MYDAIVKRAAAAGFELDADQRRAATALARMPGSRRRPTSVYLWGPVGRGKTWLLDAAYDLIPVTRKRRTHWHAFLVDLHSLKHRLGSLDAAIDDLLGDCDLLCFDEFHVHDVGDATLIEHVLTAIVDRSIALVITSNYPPTGLLPNPLCHHRFLRSIATIESNMDVVAVAGPTDYRTLRHGERTGFAAGHFVVGTGPQASRSIMLLAGTHTLLANGTDGGSVHFTFANLCEQPTATVDYLHLARRFRKWVINDVPALATVGREAAARFCNVIDVLCDADIELTVFADVSVDRLVEGVATSPDIARTASRLALLERPVRR